MDLRARTTRSRPLGTTLGLALSALLLVGACTGRDAPADEAGRSEPAAGVDERDAGDTASRRDPVGGPPDPGAAGPGVDLATILDRAYERDASGHLVLLDDMAEPAETSVRTVQNRHDPARTDTIRTLRWDGLELVVHGAAGGKEILSEVRVTGPGYATDDGLGPGVSRSRVRELLGEPERSGDEAWTYEVFDGPEDPTPTMLNVRFEGDEVSSLVWEYYLD